MYRTREEPGGVGLNFVGLRFASDNPRFECFRGSAKARQPPIADGSGLRVDHRQASARYSPLHGVPCGAASVTEVTLGTEHARQLCHDEPPGRSRVLGTTVNRGE
jgi:hypothetical protein